MKNKILTWDEYFMSLSHLSGKRSKDPSTQVGACIVNQNKSYPNRSIKVSLSW